ncbi:MAG: UbiD family decarboxylase [Acidobacteria bacterium]|nr:UbiD family decarboxylase [Acidobacteriota bacterium]
MVTSKELMAEAKLAKRKGSLLTLRQLLSETEALGQLKVINQPIDWNEEMSTLNYMVAQKENAPVLWFKNIKDAAYGSSAVFNLFGTGQDRIALGLGLEPGRSLQELIEFAKNNFGRRVPPRTIPAEKAAVNEIIIEGADIDLNKLPSPKMWPRDGGRYLGTWDVLVTRDRDDGHLNLGTYRQMIHGPRELFCYWSPGKDARLQSERYWAKNEPFPVAAVYGCDPVLLMVGCMTLPKTESEYDYAGGLVNEPIEVFRSELTGLDLPASAEIIVEGFMRPGKLGREGPFGEFTGYYGRPEANTPIIDVERVRIRKNPILTCALMADHPANELGLLYGIVRGAKIWDDLEKVGVPGVKGVYCFPAGGGGFGITAVSIEQRYPGHASQVAALAAQTPAGAYYAKLIIVVDDDVDPTDIHQVLWAMATRFSPEKDIDILRQTWSTWLDPTKNPPEERPWGSKALINACKEHKYLKVFSPRNCVRRSVYERMAARWKEFGLEGEVPRLRAFDEETDVTPLPLKEEDEGSGMSM